MVIMRLDRLSPAFGRARGRCDEDLTCTLTLVAVLENLSLFQMLEGNDVVKSTQRYNCALIVLVLVANSSLT